MQLLPTKENDLSTPATMAAGALNILAAHVHQVNIEAGWWTGPNGEDYRLDKHVIGTKIALIHSEVSEMLEGVRKGKMDTHLPHRTNEEVEAADTMIRILDLAKVRGWDLGGAIIEKMAYNATREDHTAAARAAAGGKAY